MNAPHPSRWGSRFHEDIAEIFGEAAELGDHYEDRCGDQYRAVGVRLFTHPGCSAVLGLLTRGDRCRRHVERRKHPRRWCRHPGCGVAINHKVRGDYCGLHFKEHDQWRESHRKAMSTRAERGTWLANTRARLARMHTDPATRARLRRQLDEINRSKLARSKIADAIRAGYAAHPERKQRLSQQMLARLGTEDGRAAFVAGQAKRAANQNWRANVADANRKRASNPVWKAKVAEANKRNGAVRKGKRK